MSIIEKAMGKRAKGSDANSADSKPKVELVDRKGTVSSPSPAERTAVPRQPRVDANDPKLIHISEQRLKDLGMVNHNNDRANLEITNEYRSIKHKLLYNAFGLGAQAHENGNLVMVSSTMPGEGKTFTSVNLALSLASEKDKTVLLIDSDILKPDVSNLLDIEPRAGLIDYLTGEVADVGDVIYPTSVPNLRLLPAGSWTHDSNELLASAKMEQLILELSTRYTNRMVVFDCPPILGVVETVTISKYLGQAMLVVEPGRTKMANIDAAVSQLSTDMTIGFIINKVAHSSRASYGYGYGYGYGQERE